MELKYEPIGKIKLTKSQYWELKANKFKRMTSIISSVAFILGFCIGIFIRIF